MTDTNGTTNGNSESSNGKPSALSLLLKEHNQLTEGGKKEIPKKTQSEAYAKFEKLLAERDAAQLAAEKAAKAFTEHAETMVRVFGDYKIELKNGRRFFAASRGETVFYREEGKVDQTKVFRG